VWFCLVLADRPPFISSFQRLATCVEIKVQRGLTRPVLESRLDVKEVEGILFKVSTRIEAYLVRSLTSAERDTSAHARTLVVREHRFYLNRYGERSCSEPNSL